jgi:predicted alpha/beta-hydrolase family hydrolase
LASIPGAGYFDPAARHRVVILLTDGETRPYDSAGVSKQYGAPPRASLIAVRFWRADEAIYRTATRADPSYRPDPASAQQLAGLAAVTGGRVFQEGELAASIAAIRGALGSGPTREVGRVQRIDPLAPYVALLALLPLAFLFSSRAGRGRRRAPERSASVPG